MSKRISKKRKPNWLSLDDDVLELILKKLSYPDLVRFSTACRWWQKSAKSFNAVSRPILLLTIPSDQYQWCYNPLSFKIFSVGEDKVIRNLFGPGDSSKRYRYSYCVGYSNSMLVFAGRATSLKPVVLNPFSRRRFRLPRINVQDFPLSPRELLNFSMEKRIEIRKALVLSRSNTAPPVLVIMYSISRYFDPSLVAYCELGPGGSWAHLNTKKNHESSFEDMVCREGRLYVLASCNSVEAWDFNHYKPVMVMSFVPTHQKFPTSQKLINGDYVDDDDDDEKDSISLCGANLVESMGEILLVRRWEELYGPSPGTVKFDVYKMQGRIWEKLESLGDHRALFLGSSESLSVSSKSFAGCRGNSIYFLTTSQAFMYDFDDIGVYSLEDRSVKTFYKSRAQNLDASPFWLIPNPL